MENKTNKSCERLLMELIRDNPKLPVWIRVSDTDCFNGYDDMHFRIDCPRIEEVFQTDEEVIYKWETNKYLPSDIEEDEWEKVIVVPLIK